MEESFILHMKMGKMVNFGMRILSRLKVKCIRTFTKGSKGPSSTEINTFSGLQIQCITINAFLNFEKHLLPSLIEVALMLILIRKDTHNFNVISV